MGKQLKVKVDFPIELYEAVRKAAAREKKSIAEFVNASIREALEAKGKGGRRVLRMKPSPPRTEG